MNAFVYSRVCAFLCAAAVLAFGQTADLSQTVRGVDFKMKPVGNGNFQMGCPASNSACGSTERDQHQVTLTYDYYISETQVTEALWRAVMTDSSVGTSKKPKTGITWYNAVTFTCKLSQQTGKKYRLATEAEWEFAARGGNPGKANNYAYSGSNSVGEVAWTKDNVPQTCYGSQCFAGGAQDVGGKRANELGLYDMSGNVYEWTFDNWKASFNSAAVTNPLDPHKHTQKVRRGGSAGQPAAESRVSGRKIRSIEGKDGEIGIRLALSVADSRPVGMADPCDIHQPPPTRGTIGLRDERLITGSDSVWVNDMSSYMQDGQTMAYAIKIWADGTARMAMIFNGQVNTYMGGVSGEWYTLNAFSLNIVSGSDLTKYAYYLVSSDEMSIIGDANGNDGPVGRFERMPVSSYPGTSGVTKPAITNPRAAEVLAPAGANSCDNLNIMTNPPENQKDPLLIEGTDNGWWQNNASAGGTHHYRKDFNDTPNNARFVVYDLGAGTSTRLAEGEWFTVNNTFLRIKQKDGSNTYNFDYLYTVSKDGKNFRHISFQEYEPGDFRMFAKTPNNDIVGWFAPGSTFYHQGHSTYLPPVAPSSSSGASGCGDSSPSSSSVLSSSSAVVASSSSIISSSSVLSSSSVPSSSSSAIAASSSSVISSSSVPSSSSRGSSSSIGSSSSSSEEEKVNLPSSSSEEPSSSSINSISSSSDAVSPIRVPQTASGPLFAYATGKTIVLGNVPKGAKIDIYNLQGKRIYNSPFSTLNSQLIPVQAKGIYFIKVNNQALRIPVM